MRVIIRYFFKLIRIIAGPIMLAYEWTTAPHAIIRPPEKQRAIDQATRGLALYQFKTCPFCIKVRHECKRLALNIETRDAQHNTTYRNELEQATGKIQVPCLKITTPDGKDTWMLESDLIIAYLQARFTE